MARHRILVSILAALSMCSLAHAQSDDPPVPPANGMKLSELIASIEKRDQFRYIDEIDWEDEGFYSVTYHTADKAKVEIKLDPVSGKPR